MSDELNNKLQIIRAKADLLCMGVRVNEVAKEIFERQNPGETFKTGNVGMHISLKGGSHVLVTVSHFFDQESPYSILRDDDSGSLVLAKDGKAAFAIDEVGMPSWYHKRTSTCQAMMKVFLHEGKAYLHQAYSGCDYHRTGVPCKFCGTGRHWEMGTPVEIGETVAEAVEENPDYHVCLGGGTRLPLSRNVEYFADCLAEIRKRTPNVPVWIEMVPPETDDDISRLVDAGATSFGFNIEVWDDELRKQICPGKSQTSKRRYLKAMETALKLLGSNRVGSCLLVGLQPLEDAIQGAIDLAAIGIQPCLLPFKPWNRSVYKKRLPCNPDDFIRASTAAVQAMKANRIRPQENQGCLRCEGCSIDHDMYDLST